MEKLHWKHQKKTIWLRFLVLKQHIKIPPIKHDNSSPKYNVPLRHGKCHIFYTTGTISLAILPKKCIKFVKKLICNKTLYLTLPRVVLHIVVTNGSITLRVSKLVTLGKIILRYLGWVSKLLVKSIRGNVTLGKIAINKIIVYRFRLGNNFRNRLF